MATRIPARARKSCVDVTVLVGPGPSSLRLAPESFALCLACHLGIADDRFYLFCVFKGMSIALREGRALPQVDPAVEGDGLLA